MRLIRPFLVSLTALAVACGGGGGDGGGVTNPPPTNTTLDHITVTLAQEILLTRGLGDEVCNGRGDHFGYTA
jgi:hypothetical protein